MQSHRTHFGLRLWLLFFLAVVPCHMWAQNYFPNIVSVSVDSLQTRRVTITWNVAQPDAQQTFAVYRYSNGIWTQIVDSLPNTERSFTDKTAHPYEQPERYCIATKTPSATDSPLSDSHQTVFLSQAEYNPCNLSATLHFSQYIGCQVDQYCVFRSIDSQPYEQIGYVTDTIFVDSTLTVGANYSYYICAMLNNGARSLSNVVTMSAFQAAQVSSSDFGVLSIDNSSDSLLVTTNLCEAATVQGYAFSVNGTIDSVYSAGQTSFTLPKSAEIQFVAIDSCGNFVEGTSVLSPLEIDAQIAGDEVSITTSFVSGKTEVYVSVDGANSMVIDAQMVENELTVHLSDFADEKPQTFCFFLQTTLNDVEYRSNTICVSRQAQITIPNAFSPNGDGLNDTFGPIFTSADVEKFEFSIYDKFGNRVFATTTPTERWDGTFRGKNVKVGGYLYYVKVTLTNGSSFEKRGAVNVVR